MASEEEVIIINTDTPPKRGPGRPRKTPVNKPAPVSRRVTSSSNVSDAQAAGTIAKLLVVMTLMIMYGRIRRLRIPDVSGELAERLALTDEEAFEIAKPIARLGNSTPMGARLIGPVTRNEDIIGAMFAVYEYNRRTNQILADLTRGGSVPANLPKENDSRVTSGQVQSDRPDDGGGGIPAQPWASPFDASII